MEMEVSRGVMILASTVCVLSVAMLVHIIQKYLDGRPLLTYQPRRSVPWGPMVVVVAMAMPTLGVVAFFVGLDQPSAEAPSVEPPSVEPPSAESSPTESSSAESPSAESPPVESSSVKLQLANGWTMFSIMFFFVIAMGLWLRAVYEADAHDFGLPTSWREFVGDVAIGACATIASLVPIYIVQLTLIKIFRSETQHPLVEQLQENYSPAMLALGIAMAVIAAPIFEEFSFRCLLQGWLEKYEDEVVGYDATRRPSPQDAFDDLASPTDDVVLADPSVPFANSPAATTMERPSHGWLPELPHGWTPILISGMAFGLAHIGHGVAPISLVLFGIVLGYLYQRTHRLVPCLTAHMVFNGYSMLLLWMQLEMPAS